MERIDGQRKKKSRLFRILSGIVVGFVVIFLLILFLTPLYLSSSGGRRFLLGRINDSVDGHVGLDTFSVGWFSGVKMTNLTFDSGDGTAQVKVGRIETQPRYTSLLGGRVNLGKTVIDRPQIHLTLTRNNEIPGQSADTGAPSGAPFVMPVHLIDLELLAGDATIELLDADAQVRRVSLKNIASTVVLNEPGQTSRLDLSVDVANGREAGTVRAKGEVTPPKKGWTLEDTDGTFTVSIARLDLESLRPLLAMAGMDVQTGGVLDAEADVRMRKGVLETLTGNAVVANFSQGLGEQKVVFAEPVTLTVDVGMPGGAMKINKLNINAPFCTVECSGGMETLDYSVAADLAKTQAFARQFTDLGGYGLVGQLAAAGKLNVSEGTVASVGKGTVRNLLLSKNGQTAPQTDVSLDYNIMMDSRKGLLKVPSLSLVMLPGTVTVRDLSMPVGQGTTGPVALSAQANLDMAKAWPYAQILADAPKDLTLAGMLNAAVSAETKDDILRIKTDKTTVQKLRVTKAGREPFVQDEVKLTADVTLDLLRQSVGIHAFDMQGARGETLIKIIKGKVQQSADGGVKTLNAEVEAEYDLKTVSAMASPFLPEGLKVEGKRKDRVAVSSRWPETSPEKRLANLSGKGSFGFDKAEYVGLIFGPTEMTIDIQQGVAAVVIPDTAVNGGTMRFAGTLDLRQEPMFLRLNAPTTLLENVNINDVVTSAWLQYVNPIFAGARATSGTANLTCRKLIVPLSSNHLNQIDIDATVDIANLRMQAGDFFGRILSLLNVQQAFEMTLRPTNFLMQQGAVSYRDMMIDVGNYPLSFSGALGLDKKMAMEVKLPLSRGADAGVQTITVPLGGTVDKPTIDAGRLIQLQGQQLIEQGLQRLFR